MVGRFAPSPTGPLHFGSVVAALGSCLSARSAGGRWLLRIEDVDAPRTVPGAADQIQRTLELLGFEWDGPVIWQSQRSGAYADALARLRADGRLYGCACTRKELADSGLARDGSRRYPGTCRNGLPAGREARAFRFRVAPGEVVFEDGVQGRIVENVAEEVGDFVLLRADGLYAYQLAVVLDDAESGVTEVVRGADLLDSTPRQIQLQQALGLTTPRYAHLPVARNGAGEKLSKQTLAKAVGHEAPVALLAGALGFLGHPVPAEAGLANVAELWSWALAHWSVERVPRQRSMPAPAWAYA